MQDDEDAGSEILTDEEEAVAGMGGYLGKVAGMGNIKSEDKQNLPANIAGKSGAARSRRSSSTRMQPSLASSTSDLVVRGSRSASTLERQQVSDDQSIMASTDDLVLSPTSTEPTRLRGDSFAMVSSAPESQTEEPLLSSPISIMPSRNKDYFERMSALNNDSSVNLPALAQLRHVSSASSLGTSVTTQNASGYKSEMSLDGGHGTGFGSGARTKVTGSDTINSQAKVGAALRQLRRGGGLTKDFWMKDENCKECFLCGRSFTAWRRKHHCRMFTALIINDEGAGY